MARAVVALTDTLLDLDLSQAEQVSLVRDLLDQPAVLNVLFGRLDRCSDGGAQAG
jgi:hypothetical protein